MNDQADQLKRILAEVEHQEANRLPGNNSHFHADQSDNSTPPLPKIDVLNLPPRKEIHGIDKTRIRLRLGRPFLRFLVVTLVLIIIVIGAYIYWGEELISLIKKI